MNRVISNLVYNLKDLDGKVLGNWHVKDLKPAYSNPESDDENNSNSSQELAN